MNCMEIQEEISAFIDGELPQEKSGLLFAHIAGCQECRGFLQSSVRMRGMIARVPEPAAPPRLDARVLSIGLPAGLPDGKPRRLVSSLWQQRLRVPLPAIAAGIALVLLSTLASAWLWLSPARTPKQEVVYIFGMPQIEVYSDTRVNAQ
jgi:anti-sigma factor RsiW